ncbi:hypothetical protein DFR24_4273 [Panacagrimonas perspica]|uniref:Uncharacterized protein n=1 Tax=Panacagrimonas perspica TaxID=381431 RepID=A0A4S3K4V3_9GAMM|nr:hypothetical protein [Panacagrimonas perspica]TDU25828.1 hypothetical protein DFR24_4273 [Panacagrimonas perspica]THD02804.1 hypothetical protein B1810_12855 [Panacagrimonas perspica]
MLPFTRHLSRPLLALLLPLSVATAQAAPDIAKDNAGSIKGQTQVVIAEFGVEFYTQIHAQGRAGGASAAITTHLVGVSDASLQAITDQAYADTVSALTAAGFQVMDSAALQSQPIYQELAGKYGQPAPFLFSDGSIVDSQPSLSRIFAPAGMKVFIASGKARGDLRQRIDVQNQARGDREGELAKAVGATLLHVNYLVSFGETSATKNGLLAGIAGKARVSIDAKPLLVAEETQIQFVTSAGKRTFTNSKRPRHTGAVYLDEPLVSPVADLFALTETTTAETKRADGMFNAVGSLLGSSAAEKNKANEVAVSNEDNYRSTYQALIGEAATALVGTLAANR